MKKNLSLLKRIGILSILCFCLGFVAITNNTQTASAAPCCSTCEVPLFEDEFAYCENYCGASSGTCYNSCLTRVRRCWQICWNC
jgi:hypothetical protein